MKILNKHYIDRTKIQRILDSPIPYEDESQKELAEYLVSTLTPEQVEYAAQGSFAYWFATVAAASSNDNPPPTSQERLKMATREARRFYGCPNLEVAERLLKEACTFRKERRVDLIRSCFIDEGMIEYASIEDEMHAQRMRQHITNDLSKQASYVRGRDIEGRALLVIHPRTSAETDEEEFLLTQIYLVERAIAASEWDSEGRIEKITAVYDFATFQSSLAPPINAVKEMVSMLQNCYSERLKKSIIVDPPFWMRTMFSMLRPFLDPITASKFIMASGSKAKKQKLVSEMIREDQAMPFLLPSGKLIDEVDIHAFLQYVPFQCGYDPKYKDVGYRRMMFHKQETGVTTGESSDDGCEDDENSTNTDATGVTTSSIASSTLIGGGTFNDLGEGQVSVHVGKILI